MEKVDQLIYRKMEDDDLNLFDQSAVIQQPQQAMQKPYQQP